MVGACREVRASGRPGPRAGLCTVGLLSALSVGTASPAAAAEFPLAPTQVVVGSVETYVTKPGDTLLDLAHRYDLGYTEIVAANRGVDPWAPGTGRRIVIPGQFLLPDAPRRGIIVNLAERRLFYFPPHRAIVETFPIGVGVDAGATPIGSTRVVAKQANPVWYPPASIRAEEPNLPRAVPAGPDNPLGAFALALGWPGYLIHGTDKPDGVGRNVSHGCIRLYPEDIARLFREVPIGTQVAVTREPVVARWTEGDLLIAAYPSHEQADELDVLGTFSPSLPAGLTTYVASVARDEVHRIDWSAVARVGLERTGLPTLATDPRPDGWAAAG
jgi:L,D-transpeptidase ErfK/SrfK